MSGVSSENKEIIRCVGEVIGREPKIFGYMDEGEQSHIDIATFEGRPKMGINTYSTLGLSDHPLLKTGDGKDLGIEILGVCEHSCKDFIRTLSTVAFCAM